MNSIWRYPDYLSGHHCASFCAFRTTEMDELAVGRKFTDFESLPTADSRNTSHSFTKEIVGFVRFIRFVFHVYVVLCVISCIKERPKVNSIESDATLFYYYH